MASLVALFGILFGIALSANVNPTITNSSGEYYIASQLSVFAKSLSGNTIVCTSVPCHVICDKASSCQNTQISASQSPLLNIECSQSSSCSGMQLLNGPTSFININCTYHGNDRSAHDLSSTDSSCGGAIFYAVTTPNANVRCDSIDCKKAQFHFNESETVNVIMDRPADESYTLTNIYGTNVSTSLTVQCLHSNSCRENRVVCPVSNEAECIILCRDGLACQQMAVYVPNKDYESLYIGPRIIANRSWGGSAFDEGEFHCLDTGKYQYIQGLSDRQSSRCREDSSSSCCVLWNAYNEKVIECDAGKACTVECSDLQCVGTAINAIGATSLTVQCDDASVCANVEIICPEGDDAQCVIECSAQNACSNALVEMHTVRLFNLSCSGETACRGMQLWPHEFLTPVIGTMNVECNADKSCLSMIVGYGLQVSSFYMQCLAVSGCQNVEFKKFAESTMNQNAYYTLYIEDMFVLNCLETSSCNKTIVTVQLDATASSMIACHSDDDGSAACDHARFRLLSASTFKLDCFDNDCGGMQLEMDYPSSVIRMTDDASVNCRGNGSCANARFMTSEVEHFELMCNGRMACMNTEIRGRQAVASTNVYCKGSEVDVCQDMVIGSGIDYTKGYVELNCVPDNCANITFECDTVYYPHYMVKKTTRAVTDGCMADSKLVSGINDSYCCPLVEMTIIDPSMTTTASLLTTLDEDKSDDDDGDDGNEKHVLWIVILCIVFVIGFVGLWCLHNSMRKKANTKNVALLSQNITDDDEAGDTVKEDYVPPTENVELTSKTP